MITNWKTLIEKAAQDDTIIFSTLSEEELLREFNDDYGLVEGTSFTAWGEKWVYFPACYDGSEWVDRVPRNPCSEVTAHIGGG